MKLPSMLTGIALATMICSTAPVMAHEDHQECNVSLNYDLTMEPKKMVFSSKGKEQYRIEPGRLFVDGEEVSLNSKQKALLEQYSDGLAKQVPEFVTLVTEAVSLASQAVSMALTPLLGDDTGAKVDELVANLQKRMDKVMYRNGDSYYVGATEDSMDEVFNEEFEQEIEQMVQNSVGTLMINLGSQILSADGGSFEEKMENFGKKMESIGDDIEKQMEAQAEVIEARADKMCENFEELLVLENRVREEIPELRDYPLAQREQVELRE
ncbi:YggN family protein [Shewanella cyperi]|uniref:YggN family protein n=1 Tax=Shewanella cyperi TaxID=2814292 RepID=A0A974XPM8_9GAMM|nr:YggN family protein [Shewanella cyperi]QSX30956.1 YggN family protein [Shewanella cyperi]QSX41733.1 YggN family protein [Shewanella cyperi]